jgi:hypothetical protein
LQCPGVPVAARQGGDDQLSAVLAGRGDVAAGAAVCFFDQDAGPPPAHVPGDELPQVGIVLVGPRPLADHAERVAAVVLADVVGDADGDVRAQVGVAVVAQQAGPVAV